MADRLECGTAWVNHHAELSLAQPFAGDKDSGVGVAGGPWGLYGNLRPFVVHRPRGVTVSFRAAVLRGYEDPFTVEEVTLGTEPGAGEILVEIAGCGMCRTDLAVRRSAGRSPLPAVLGHEGSGVVVRTGGGPDTAIGVGDHVVLSFDSCGHCRNCRAAAPAYCDSFASLNLFGGRAEDPPRLTDGSGAALAPRWFGQSAFAEYALVSARNAVRVDPALPVELLGPLGCGFLTGAGAVLNTFAAGPGDTLVVLGAGAVGLAAVMAATAAGAPSVAVDRNPVAWSWPSGSARSRCPPRRPDWPSGSGGSRTAARGTHWTRPPPSH